MLTHNVYKNDPHRDAMLSKIWHRLQILAKYIYIISFIVTYTNNSAGKLNYDYVIWKNTDKLGDKR